MNLSRLDMNLLKVLSVLIEERSVTRAGARLGRTQSAVSNALHRLRRLLDDELLVRGPGGLALTPRAEAIRAPLKELMGLAEQCLARGAGFDAAQAQGVFRIAMPDRLSLPLLPPLLERLRQEAPSMALHVVTAERERAMALLDADAADIALGSPERLPPHVKTAFLFDDALVCLCRRDHPLLRDGAVLDAAALLACPHLVVSATGGRTAMFDSLLSRHGLDRRPAVSVSNFSAVPQLLRNSDMIGVFTRRVASVLAQSAGLETRPLPIALPALQHFMMWHARNERDPRHGWLRERIRAVCDAV